VRGATFDAGMLVALDRNERDAWVVLRRLINRGEVPTIPTVVTAQNVLGKRRRASVTGVTDVVSVGECGLLPRPATRRI